MMPSRYKQHSALLWLCSHSDSLWPHCPAWEGPLEHPKGEIPGPSSITAVRGELWQHSHCSLCGSVLLIPPSAHSPHLWVSAQFPSRRGLAPAAPGGGSAQTGLSKLRLKESPVLCIYSAIAVPTSPPWINSLCAAPALESEASSQGETKQQRNKWAGSQMEWVAQHKQGELLGEEKFHGWIK